MKKMYTLAAVVGLAVGVGLAVAAKKLGDLCRHDWESWSPWGVDQGELQCSKCGQFKAHTGRGLSEQLAEMIKLQKLKQG